MVHVATNRFDEFFHEKSKLAAKLASDADERQFTDLLNADITLEHFLDEWIFAFSDERRQWRMKSVVVLLNELCLQHGGAIEQPKKVSMPV